MGQAMNSRVNLARKTGPSKNTSTDSTSRPAKPGVAGPSESL
jgi:hypothetical protein